MTFPYDPKPGTTGTTLQQQVDQLNERVRLLESALKVSASEVVLKTNGTLRLQGALIHLN